METGLNPNHSEILGKVKVGDLQQIKWEMVKTGYDSKKQNILEK